ncbi:TPA: hypothetical protein DCZ39_04425 [Patescibacteria group bacterium]|nr:hypothetical protein [Candidatus Gracilibacteria bacterium]
MVLFFCDLEILMRLLLHVMILILILNMLIIYEQVINLLVKLIHQIIQNVELQHKVVHRNDLIVLLHDINVVFVIQIQLLQQLLQQQLLLHLYQKLELV